MMILLNRPNFALKAHRLKNSLASNQRLIISANFFRESLFQGSDPIAPKMVVFGNSFDHVRRIGSIADENKTKGKVYLHIGPSGDCWTGSSIFAAKHLQPDYVKSVEIPIGIVDVEAFLETIENDPDIQKFIYDNSMFPESLLSSHT